jgi:hypothetical protein
MERVRLSAVEVMRRVIVVMMKVKSCSRKLVRSDTSKAEKISFTVRGFATEEARWYFLQNGKKNMYNEFK